MEATPKFTYTDEHLLVGAHALLTAQGTMRGDFEDKDEWNAAVANAETDVETVLESIGGHHIDTVLIPDN